MESTIGIGETLVESTVDSFVYALGRIKVCSPSLAFEKEIAQVASSPDLARMASTQAIREVLSPRTNRYLARQACWILAIERIETYILQPRDTEGLDLLINTIHPAPCGLDVSEDDASMEDPIVDVVVGVRGPEAPPGLCNGRSLPIVLFDQVFSFRVPDDVSKYVKPRLEGRKAETVEPAVAELYRRMTQMADNLGETDRSRAVNYLAVPWNEPAIYNKATELSLSTPRYDLRGVTVEPSRLGRSGRKIYTVAFTFDGSDGMSQQWFVRVDVTDEFPFMFTHLKHGYER